MNNGGAAPIWTDGDAYEKFMGQWSRLVGREFLQWLSCPKEFRWLELGCGTGAFTEVILQDAQPTTIVGLEPAEAQIAFARDRVNSSIADFQVGSGLDAPFGDNEFDISVSALVLNFVPDQPKMIAEMKRVTRAEGIIALYVWDFAGRMSVGQHIAAAIAAKDPEAGKRAAAGQQFQTTSEKFLSSLFGDAGLRNIETRAIEIDVTFDDYEDYWSANTEFASPIGQFVHGLSKDENSEFKDFVRQRVPVTDDGSIKYIARANAIRSIV